MYVFKMSGEDYVKKAGAAGFELGTDDKGGPEMCLFDDNLSAVSFAPLTFDLRP